MNEFNKGRKRAIKLHGCGGAVEQVSFNFYICILRFCAVMSLVLRQSACYWSYYALPDSLYADCASRQYPEQHQRFCIVNSMLQSKGRQEIDVFGGHFLTKIRHPHVF